MKVTQRHIEIYRAEQTLGLNVSTVSIPLMLRKRTNNGFTFPSSYIQCAIGEKGDGPKQNRCIYFKTLSVLWLGYRRPSLLYVVLAKFLTVYPVHKDFTQDVTNKENRAQQGRTITQGLLFIV